MIYTYKNSDAFDVLIGEDSLLETVITSISIAEKDYQTVIRLEIQMRPNSQFKTISLIFQDVSEYCFYWEKNYSFGDVSEYKLLKGRDEYYLSLDPDESSTEETQEDQDFIRAQYMKIEAVKRPISGIPKDAS